MEDIHLDIKLDTDLSNIKVTRYPQPQVPADYRAVYTDSDSIMLVKDGQVQKPRLYIDALNISTQLGFTKKAWSTSVPIREIERFVLACEASGWELKVFIDAGVESAEALAKWKSRREQEVKDAYRDVPHAMASLMGDIFRQFGVKVYYSPWNVDNDDCIAYFAQRDGAAVLSNDLDFARYRGKTYQQYGDFEIEKGKLILIPKKVDERRLPSPRDLLTSEPKMVDKYPGFVYLKENATYVRGSPSFATKFYGNLHGHVKDLRYFLYHLMRLERVEESWPEYSEESGVPEVLWIENSFVSDRKIMALPSIEIYYRKTRDAIFAPVLAVPDFTDEEKWNFEMAIMLVISELYAMITKTSTLSVFLHLRRTTPDIQKCLSTLDADCETNVPAVCRNWKAEGICRFGYKCVAASGHFVCSCWRGEKCRYRH